MASAAKLGRQAVAAGMEPLDVTRFHEQGLVTWVSPGGSHKATPRMFELANAFFAETVIPIEKTHRAARIADIRVNRLTETLRRRTAESSASTSRLKQSIIQREGAEAALKEGGKQHARLLANTQRLQKHLRRLTHACLWAHEHAQTRVSRRLYDEIAQTLLAINLRLLLLKTSARARTKRLTKEVANTQSVVKQYVRRFGGGA